METGMGTITALLIFGICGFVGILLDIDHLFALLIWRYWKPTFNNGRFLHKYYLITACLIFLGVGTYLGGLYMGQILGGLEG